MADLHIPPKFRAALVHLATLGDQAVGEISDLLEAAPGVLTSRDAAQESVGRLTKVSPEDGMAILEAVIPLLFYKSSQAFTTDQVLKSVVKTLKGGAKDEAKLSASQTPAFEKNIGRLLDLSQVALKAKALSLATECPRLFTDSKIISDLRPIFGTEVSQRPLGAAVIHTMRIAFAEDSAEKEFFVQMDLQDLKSLHELVARAIQKDSSLKTFLQETKLQIFETSI